MSTIRTRVARAVWGGNRFRGHSVENDLAGRKSHAQALLLAISGRVIDGEVAAIVDDLEICMLAADPRIWPCKVARLAASRGSALSGYAASLLAQESDAVGCWSTLHGARWMQDLSRRLGPGVPELPRVRELVLADIAEGKRFYGYGVPLRPVDERVVAARRCVAARGRSGGRFETIALHVSTVLEEVKRLPINIGGYATAVLLDLGFEPEEIRLVTTISLELPLLANAVEGATAEDPPMVRLPDEEVAYVGPALRRSARFRG